jgi:Lrp/AsnC family transcriptional regulator for asnA, asnC and gidA
MFIVMDSIKKVPSDSNLYIDGFDRELIGALREDGRQSLANLGTAIGLSGDSVKDRLDRLTNLGILKVTCTVDPKVLGYSSITLIGIKVTGPAENIAEELAKVTEFDFVACTAGEFDIIAEVVCTSEVHLLQILDSHVRARTDVASIVAFSYLQVLKFSPGHDKNQNSWATSEPPKLDAVDLLIIQELQQDGRLSYQELAERIGHPYQTTRRRARALLEEGVIHPEVLINRLVEGTAVIAGVNLRTTGPITEIARALAKVPEVEVAVLTTGSFDLMLEVACRDREHLAQLVGETLPAIPGVVSTETNIYLRVVKLPQSWLGLVRQL